MSADNASGKRTGTGENVWEKVPPEVAERGSPPRDPVYVDRVTHLIARESDDPNEIRMPREAFERLGVEPGHTVYLTNTGGGTVIAGVPDIQRRIKIIYEVLEERREALAALAKL